MKLAQRKMSVPGRLPCFPAKEALVDEDVEQQMESGKDEVGALPWWLLTSLLVFVRGSLDDHQPRHADLDRGYKSTSTSRKASKGCPYGLIEWLWFVTGIT